MMVRANDPIVLGPEGDGGARGRARGSGGATSGGDELHRLARFLDSQFEGPFGFRFGWDGIIGLVPGFGDLFTTILSLYILFGASERGVGPSILARMGANIFFDKLIGAVPVLGWIGDFAYKSNLKNIELIHRFEGDPARTRRGSRWVVAMIIAGTGLCLAGLAIGAFFFARWVWFAISSRGSAPSW